MKKLLVLTIFAIATISCSHNINSDGQKPVIEDLKIVNLDSANSIVFHNGANIQFSANFVDNQELGSYKFDVHFAGDGHRHTHIEPRIDDKKSASSTKQWNTTKNGKLEGTEQRVTFNRTIQFEDKDGHVLKTVANSGPYHCVVYAIDEAGNSADFIQTSFLIVNEDMPKYTITEPDFTDYKIATGDTLTVKGSVYGKKGLSKLVYIVYYLDTESAVDLIHESKIIEGNVKDYDINLQLNIPSEAKTGNYALLLLVSDKVGNVGQLLETFEITN